VTKAIAPLGLILATAAAIAGCGGGGGGSDGYGSGGVPTDETAPAATAPTGAVLSAAQAPKLGRVLVDSRGLTLYDFGKDGATSSCYGACARVWPPLLTEGAPQAGEGANPSKLGTAARRGGTTQVAYAGHPLYTYVEDTEPGEANGIGISSFGGRWYALEPSGRNAG
jgi:predicted lipoprotein with Yx(FWY)xxD motif